MKSDQASMADVTRNLAELSAGSMKGSKRRSGQQVLVMLSCMQPQPLSLAEIRQQVLIVRPVLLEYYFGQERSYLWAVTSTSIESL